MRETVEDLGVRRKKRRQERVGSVVADPDNLYSSEKAGRGAQGTQGLGKNCTPRKKSMPPWSRLIRGFHNKYH